MERFQWSHLTTQQVGAYAEYFVKMELTTYGFQVYSAEVDDRGIDFIARYQTRPFLEIQVKSLRSFGYIFMRKAVFQLRESLYVAFVLFTNGESPSLFLIPSTVWNSPDEVFVSRDYEGLKSEPEWGLNVSIKNLSILESYQFEHVMARLGRVNTI